ncbi:MAG: hypothetical protein R3Y47_12135 [Lachnospiraceae bacterium]
METYSEMKHRQQEEINGFPIMFAFNDTQFNEGMQKLGLEPSDTDKIYSLGNTGGFIRKTDSKALDELLTRHEQEMSTNIAKDKTGEGFIFEMFYYELGNHEYIITGDVTETLDALGIEEQEVNDNPALINGLRLAHNKQMETHQNMEEMER